VFEIFSFIDSYRPFGHVCLYDRHVCSFSFLFIYLFIYLFSWASLTHICHNGETKIIIHNTVQSSNTKAGNEEKSTTIGEEPNLNEPQTYDEAIKAPDADGWMDAMKLELNVLDKMCVWEVTWLPKNMNIIGSKWVYCYKYNSSSCIIKKRAHLVAQGFKYLV
jgi:hypothetical protein